MRRLYYAGCTKKHPYDAFFGGKGNFFEISNEGRVIHHFKCVLCPYNIGGRTIKQFRFFFTG